MIEISFFSGPNSLLSVGQTDIFHTPAPKGAGVLLLCCFPNFMAQKGRPLIGLESGMTKPTITINELDAERLDALLAQPAFANTDVAAR
ncbi:Regulator of nucleoside diphosphate kinase [Serratia fonticola]|uniref:Regulator of nucleoside diphosphate kinase n=1 Tax=Serratia fonticola TaxID=47917 RepID=A0A4U9W9I2_SERFO|nr:Regulator of nucleoside diphosphate kinase [Serratia fonticola]